MMNAFRKLEGETASNSGMFKPYIIRELSTQYDRGFRTKVRIYYSAGKGRGQIERKRKKGRSKYNKIYLNHAAFDLIITTFPVQNTGLEALA